jgi:hypothetical protein
MSQPQLSECRKCHGAIASNAPRCPHCGCKTPFTWTTYPCRVCQKAVGTDAMQGCPHCGCPDPFKCHVCGKEVQTAQADGKPVCLSHTLVQCERCKKMVYSGSTQIVDYQGRDWTEHDLVCPECYPRRTPNSGAA